jgi:PAS domain-containing protein
MASLRHGFEEAGDVQDIRVVVDTIPTLAWSAGPDGSAEFFNQRWLDYTGLSANQALDWGLGGCDSSRQTTYHEFWKHSGKL